MELFLTPFVNRLLRKFVKSSQEGNDDYRAFKASISGGGIALHNLELDLSIFAPFVAKRAFARFLEVKIPWTSLNTQPIEIIFDTIEVILSSPSHQTESSHENAAQQELPSTDTETSTNSGWLGSWLSSGLRSLIIRVGLNLSFSIKNILIKYVHEDQFVSTIALEKLSFASDLQEEWHELVKSPSAWLKKDASLNGLSISLDPCGSSASVLPTMSYLPILRVSSLRFSILSPIFAYVEGIDLLRGDEPMVSVGIELGKIFSSLNDCQLVWMKQLSHFFAVPTQAMEEKAAESNAPAELACLGPLGKIWFFAVEKAAYLEDLETKQSNNDTHSSISTTGKQSEKLEEDDSSALQLSSRLDFCMHAELSVIVKKVSLQLDKISSRNTHTVNGTEWEPLMTVLPCFLCEIGGTELYSSSVNTEIQEIDMQLNFLSFKHRVDGMLVPSSSSDEKNAVWDEFLGLHPTLPAMLDGEIEDSEPSFRFVYRAWQEDQDPVCLIASGQLWMVYNQGLLDDFHSLCGVFLDEFRQGELVETGIQRQAEACWWLPYIKDSIELDMGMVHLIAKSQHAQHAVELLSTGLRYKYSPQGNAAMSRQEQGACTSWAPPMSASFSLAIVHGAWQACNNRSTLSALPGAVAICENFRIACLLSIERWVARELRIFSIDICLHSKALESILSIVGDEHGDITMLPSIRLSLSDGINLQRESNDGAQCIQVPRFHIAILMHYCHERPLIESVLEIQNILCRFSTVPSSLHVAFDVATLDMVQQKRPSSSSSSVVALNNDNSSNIHDTYAEQQPFCTITNASYSQQHEDARNGHTENAVSITSIDICADPVAYAAFGDFLASIKVLSSWLVSYQKAESSVLERSSEWCTSNDGGIHSENLSCSSSTAAQRTPSFGLTIQMISWTLFPKENHHGITGFASHLSWKSRGAFDKELSVHCCDIALCTYGKILDTESTRTLLRISNARHEVVSPALVFTMALAPGISPQQRNFSLNMGCIDASCSPVALSTFSVLQESLDRPIYDTSDNAPIIAVAALSPPPPRLHGSIIFDQQVSMVVLLDPWQPETGLQLTMKEAFILVHEESAKDCHRPWFNNTAVVSTVCDGTLVDLKLDATRYKNGTASATPIIMPITCRLGVQRWNPTGASAISFTTDEVHLKLSQSLLLLVTSISQGFSSLSNSTAEAVAEVNIAEGEETHDTPLGANDGVTAIVDDVRAGAFVCVRDNDAPLPPCSILATSGMVESSKNDESLNTEALVWRYPHARRVSCIFIKQWPEEEDALSLVSTPSSSLSVSLSWLDEIRGKFVKCNATSVHRLAREKAKSFSIPEGILFVFDDGDVSAVYWQMSWSPTQFFGTKCDAIDVVSRVYINPQNLVQVGECSPMTAAMAMSFSIERCIVSMLPHSGANVGEDGAMVAEGMALARLTATDFKLSMHTWKGGAVNAQATNVKAKGLCVTFADSVGRQTMLIDHTDIRVGYTSGREGTNEEKVEDIGCTSDKQASEEISMEQDPYLIMTFCKVPRHGMHTSVVLETPMVVHVNELALYDIQRAFTLATTPMENNRLSPPLHVVNSSSIDVAVGQAYTTMGRKLLVSGDCLDIHWQHTKCLAMQLAHLPSKNSLNTDGFSSLAWSNPIEVMVSGGSTVPIKVTNDTTQMLAIEVKRDGPTWHIELRDGLQMWNHHPLFNVHVLILSNDKRKEPIFVSIEASKKCALPFLSNDTQLRVYLGKGKWSQLLYISDDTNEDDGVTVLDVDGLFTASNASWEIKNDLDGTPLLLNSKRRNQSGILDINIWPPIVLENELPLPNIALSKPFIEGSASIVLKPRSRTALSVGLYGGEIMQLNVGHTVGRYAARIFCPPLASHENDTGEEIFHRYADIQNAIFVPAPGESITIAIPEKSGSSVPCIMSTDELKTDSGPSLRLRLQPRYMIESLLPVEIKFFLQGYSRPIDIPPRSKLVLKEEIADGVIASLGVAPSLHDAMFKSYCFNLKSDQHAVVRLTHEKNLRQWITIAMAFHGTSMKDKPTTSTLTLAPAHYISNQTNTDIRICPNPQDSHASVMSLPSGQKVPLLAIWSNNLDTTFPCLHIAGAGDDQTWSDAIYLRDHKVDRANVYITDNGSTKLLTYSISEENSNILHLVLYKDRQPPYVITNKCDCELQLELSSSMELHEAFTCTLSTESSIEFGAITGTDEIEDAIAEHQIFPSVAQDAAISLRLKSQASQWSSPAIIAEGEMDLDDFKVRTLKQGRTLCVTIESSLIIAKTSQSIETASTTVIVSGIELILWDDGRTRHESVPVGSKMVTVELGDVAWKRISCDEANLSRSTVHLSIKALDCSTHIPASANVVRFSSESAPLTFSVESTSLLNEDVYWIDNASIKLPQLLLYVDDDALKIMKVCQSIVESFKGSLKSEAETIISPQLGEATEQTLYIGELSISDLSALVDLHLSVANTGLPMAIDTHLSPVTISGVQSHSVFGSPTALYQGLKTHVVAEALFNAGSVVGSLQLLGNPTGLLRSIKRGVTDIFDKGIGVGSVTLVKEVSGWSVSSTVGFFNAFIGLRRK